MRATAVEHQADEQAVPRAADAQREESAASTPELAVAQPGLIDARLLLGLQSRAGNPAVAQLIEQQRKPGPEQQAAGASGAQAEEAPAEPAAVEPTEGERDEDLVALDVVADAPAADLHGNSEREMVAQDAQAEISGSAWPMHGPGLHTRGIGARRWDRHSRGAASLG